MPEPTPLPVNLGLQLSDYVPSGYGPLWMLPCGPDCRWRYGWCFTHNVSTSQGAEPWRP